LLVAVLVGVSFLAAFVVTPRVAYAQPVDTSANDAEVDVLVQSVFESEYPKKQYVEALEKLQLASTVCQEGSCSAKVRARVLVGVATVLAGGLKQDKDAIEVFRIALQEDPKVGLIKGFDRGPIKDAWEKARKGAKLPGPAVPEPTDRKKYPGGMRAPRGWKTAEAHFYFQEAIAAQDERSWGLCVGYATDSLGAEDRVGTKLLRAQCADRGGKWVQALADYEAVAEQAPGLGMHDQGKTARARFEELKAKVPKLVLRPPARVDALEVSLDGDRVPNDKLGGELWADPGQRRVTASGKIGDQNVSFERDVTLDEGTNTTIDIKLVPKDSRITDNRILKCLEQSKSREELAECIGEGTGAPINVGVSVEVSGYIDSDHTLVFSPAVAANVENPTDGWGFGGSFLVDVVSTASTDIVATASPRWTEVRYVPGINAFKKFGDFKLGLGGGASIEPDYLSIAAGINGSVDLADKRVTPSLAYGFGYDLQGRAGTSFSTFSTTIYQNSIDAGVSIVADKATVVTAGVTSIFQTGDTSKPYRYVPMFDPEIAPLIPVGLAKEEVDRVRNSERVLEQLPTDRARFAVYGRVAHRLETSTFRIDERLYIDTWGVKASSTDAMWLFDVDPVVRLWPHLRGHVQSGAEFWQLAYASRRTTQGLELPNVRTGDRELGPLLSVTGGAGARFSLGEQKNWGISVNADAIYTRYLNHLFILERWGGYAAVVGEVDVE
jgi:hypothetical protein